MYVHSPPHINLHKHTHCTHTSRFYITNLYDEQPKTQKSLMTKQNRKQQMFGVFALKMTKTII